MTAVLPLTLSGVLVLGGCSADIWPGADDLPVPSTSPSASAAPEAAEPPAAAATVAQVKAIVDDVAEVAAAADASLDPQALAPRFAGPALEQRSGNYAIRKADSAYAAPGAIPTDNLSVSLPQITGDTWPRTMMVVVQGEGETPTAPVALTLEQESPRDKYKVLYLVTLEPAVEFPQLAPKGVGALPLGPESPVLSTPPGALMPAYADVVNLGEQSPSYGLFDIETDTFLTQIGAASRDARKAAAGADAALEFANVPGESEIIALSSNEAGALVSASLKESVTAKPATAGASLNSEGAIKSLSGVATSTKGFVADYNDQLLFYIPPVGSTEKITLLGFSQGLVSAKELP